MPRTIQKLSLREFYHSVHLFGLFRQLKLIKLHLGTQVGTMGAQAPEERSLYNIMLAQIPLSVEEVVLQIGHMQSQKSKHV